MAFTLQDLIEAARASRQHFFKHVEGLREDQWDWQPYPQCKSVRETLLHLLGDDRALLFSLQTGETPDWEKLYDEPERDVARIRALLDASQAKAFDYIQTRYSESPLDTEVSIWGSKMKLGAAVAHLTSEDFYHAGQVAFIRQATDPEWDYYAAIYGA